LSENAFRKLDTETQAIFKQAGREAAEYTVEVGKKADSEIVDFLKSEGMEVNQADIDAFVQASKPIWDEWVQEYGDDARKVTDLIANEQ